jgi:hypothetical protein
MSRRTPAARRRIGPGHDGLPVPRVASGGLSNDRPVAPRIRWAFFVFDIQFKS